MQVYCHGLKVKDNAKSLETEMSKSPKNFYSNNLKRNTQKLWCFLNKINNHKINTTKLYTEH